MHEFWFALLWCGGAYLLGSLSAGDLVARSVGVDIRTLGTGNPGAVNIYKEIGPRWGVAVLALDVGTGAIATVPLYALGYPHWMRLLAVAAVLSGHMFPVFWRFSGGTGGAVAMGTTFGLLPLGALAAALGTGAALLLTRTPVYSVWLFFVVTLMVGGTLHRDPMAVLSVLLAMIASTIKFLSQSQIRSVSDLRKALNL